MFKLLLTTFFLLFISVSGFTQDTLVDSEKVYIAVDEMPEPKEGYNNFYKYVEQNVRYPQEAIDKQIQGYVFIKFQVDKNGRITSPEILKGLGYGCDEEVLRVFVNAPPWKPGKEKGKRVIVEMTFSVIFRF